MPSKHLLNKWAGPAGGQQLANSSPKSHGQWRQDVSPGWGLWAPPLNRLSLVPNPHFTGKRRLRECEEPKDQGQSWVWIASSVCPSCLGRTPGRKAPRGPHAAPEAWTGRGNGKPRPCRQLLPLATSLPKERRRLACVSSSQRPGGSFAKSKM